jgi:hypothetical protein
MRFSPALRGSLPFAGLIALVGCTAPAVGEIEAEEAQSSRAVKGLITVERSASADVGTGDVITTNVSAKFMRLHGVEADVAERVVGARHMPEAFDCVELASLETIGVEEATRSASESRGNVEFVDVGDIALQIRGETPLELVPRAFPDVGDFASGIFYTSPDAQHELTLPAPYVVRGTGAPPIPPFAIAIEAPSAPKLLSVAGEAPASSVSLPDGSDLTLKWTPRVRVGDRAFIYADIASEGGPTYRCAFPDQDVVTLPREAFREQSDRATVAIHHVTEQDLAVDLDGATDKSAAEKSITVRFDLAETIALDLVAKPR